MEIQVNIGYVLQRNDFKRDLKVFTQSTCLICPGREFQKRGAEYEKDCSPILRNIFGLTRMQLSDFDRRFLVGTYVDNKSIIYPGHSECIDLWTIEHILYWIRFSTGSQWSFLKRFDADVYVSSVWKAILLYHFDILEEPLIYL